MPSVGLSFSPTQGASYNGPGSNNQQRGGGPVNPVQEAIRILSFRTPTVVGASAPSPQALLGGPTALGPRMGNTFAENWLRLLMQGQSPLSAGGSQGVPMMNPPYTTMPMPRDNTPMDPGSWLGGNTSSPAPNVSYGQPADQDGPPMPAYNAPDSQGGGPGVGSMLDRIGGSNRM